MAGDVFICNDPYLAGGTHIPDVSVITPVFVEGTLYFCANIAHHTDLGGPIPGSISGESPNLFWEGLRLPVIRLVRAGQLDEDLLELIACNCRESEERKLDIKVQVAANARGAALLEKLVARTGAVEIEHAVEDLLSYTGLRLRKAIEGLKPGKSTATSQMDHGGRGGPPLTIRASVEARDGRLIIDFDGTDPQAAGALNVVLSALRATVYYAVKALVDPDLLPNSGMFEGIEISAPKGSLLNPEFPAAVGARSVTCGRIARALFGAFAGILPPEKRMAAGQDIVPVMVFSGPRRDDAGSYVYVESLGGGSGARADGDGMSAVHVHITNTSNLPVEPLEIEYNLRVEEYGLVTDSGGQGRHCGGMGIARELSATADGTIFTSRSDGHRFGAPGLMNGLSGRPGLLSLKRVGGEWEELPSMATGIVLGKGDRVRLETPGGGGLGDPAARAPESLRIDLMQGKLTEETARATYGEAKVKESLGV